MTTFLILDDAVIGKLLFVLQVCMASLKNKKLMNE